MGFGSDYWAPQASLDAFTPELPGYGASPGPFTVQAALDVLVCAAKDAGKGLPVDVVGVSIGARLAILLSAQHPELVRSLAISGLGPDPSRLASLLQVGLARIAPAGAFTRHSSRASKAVTLETARAMPALAVSGSLPRIAAPTMVWWGALDKASEKASRTASQVIPGARFEAVPGGGHFWTRELPEQFESRFLNWIEGLT
jgi:pimeloyl-ACP methyl ester carboxylesterase